MKSVADQIADLLFTYLTSVASVNETDSNMLAGILKEYRWLEYRLEKLEEAVTHLTKQNSMQWFV